MKEKKNAFLINITGVYEKSGVWKIRVWLIKSSRNEIFVTALKAVSLSFCYLLLR